MGKLVCWNARDGNEASVSHWHCSILDWMAFCGVAEGCWWSRQGSGTNQRLESQWRGVYGPTGRSYWDQEDELREAEEPEPLTTPSSSTVAWKHTTWKEGAERWDQGTRTQFWRSMLSCTSSWTQCLLFKFFFWINKIKW